MTTNNIKKFNTAAVLFFFISTTACGISVKIGSEDPETQNESVPLDPLTNDSQPKHPVIRWRQEQKATQQKVVWAKAAQKALTATSQVSIGNASNCAVNALGKLRCWGNSYFGEVGRDPIGKDKINYFDSYTKNVSRLSMFGNTTCVLLNDSKLVCHGLGSANQLGQESTESTYKGVVPVGLDSQVHFVSGHSWRSCAILLDGQLKCWGWGFSKIPSNTFGDEKNSLSLDVGANHACVVTKDYGAKCWGSNSKGQLGAQSLAGADKNAPVQVDGLTQGVLQIGVGSEHSCALLSPGGVKCWGSNKKGQLGVGSTEDQKAPVDVLGLQSGVVSISLGDEFSCALLDTGKLKCWGANEFGQLGDGTTEQRSTPVDVIGLASPVTQFNASDTIACAIDQDSTAWCWGNNGLSDRLGDGSGKNSSTPVKVKDFN